MGRPKKSPEERAKSSYYRPSRHGPKTLVVPDEPVEQVVRPKSITGRSAEIWDEQVEILGGMLRRSHAMMLGPLCAVKVEFEKVVSKIEGVEPTAKEYRGLAIVLGIMVDKIVGIASKFAMSPADRAKLKVVESPEPKAAKVETRPRTKLDKAGRPK